MAGKGEAQMMRLADELTKFAVAGHKKVAILVHTGTVRKFGASPGTPVDTMRARSGGRLSLNAPSTFLPPDKGTYQVAGDSMSMQALAPMKLGDRIYWRNLVPYAVILEGGRRLVKKLTAIPGATSGGQQATRSRPMWAGSKQAPKGFLHFSIDEAHARLPGWRYA